MNSWWWSSGFLHWVCRHFGRTYCLHLDGDWIVFCGLCSDVEENVCWLCRIIWGSSVTLVAECVKGSGIVLCHWKLWFQNRFFSVCQQWKMWKTCGWWQLSDNCLCVHIQNEQHLDGGSCLITVSVSTFRMSSTWMWHHPPPHFFMMMHLIHGWRIRATFLLLGYGLGVSVTYAGRIWLPWLMLGCILISVVSIMSGSMWHDFLARILVL